VKVLSRFTLKVSVHSRLYPSEEAELFGSGAFAGETSRHGLDGRAERVEHGLIQTPPPCSVARVHTVSLVLGVARSRRDFLGTLAGHDHGAATKEAILCPYSVPITPILSAAEHHRTDRSAETSGKRSRVLRGPSPPRASSRAAASARQ
jgi:hypothetical protein